MRTIGLVPMAAKPYHAGHDGLVRIAAAENDEVHLFVSLADRTRKGEFPIYGADMKVIWDKFIEPSLPGNVDVMYVNVPVQEIYTELENAEASKDTTTVFKIYSDTQDILKYTDASLGRSAPTLLANDQIIRRGVDRNETVNISGTAMRALLTTGTPKDKQKFISLLPSGVQKNGESIYDILAKNVHESLMYIYTNSRTMQMNEINLIKNYVRSILTEGNLAPGQMRGNRFEIFLNKIKMGEPFELVGGGQAVIPPTGRGNKALMAALKAQDVLAYANAFKLGVFDADGNPITPSKLQKTKEFGGKDASVSLAAEAGQIGKIQEAINTAGDGAPIDIMLGSKLVKNIVGIEKVGGTPKADAALVDDTGKSVAYLSLKASDTPSQMQQWGGLTKITDDAEVDKFVNDVSTIVNMSPENILPYPVYRNIASKDLKKKIVYGDRSTPQDTVDIIIATLGEIRLVPQKNGTFKFECDSGEIHYYPALPSGDWDPVLLARPGRSRSDLGVKNTRLGAFPFGYRASSRQPIETLLPKGKAPKRR